MKHPLSPLVAVALLAACATPSTEPQPAQPATPAAEPAPPAAPPAPAPPPPPAVVGPAAKAQAQKLAMHAAELLEEGRAEEARTHLDQALAMDPGNRLAGSLFKQMSADPLATLGRESFAYTVRPGDTLSKIAGRFMGDIYQFYILARYNGIEAPKQLHAGQVIRVPGKAPPPEPAPAKRPEAKPAEAKKGKPAEAEPAEAPAAVVPVAPAVPVAPVAAPAEPPSPGARAYQSGLQALKAGDKEKAYAAFVQASSADPDNQDARAKADQLRKELVQTRYRNCVSAFSRQDMETAIRWCDRTLELDPNNEPARLKKAQAIELQERLKAMKK